jgi:hypothetical protein
MRKSCKTQTEKKEARFVRKIDKKYAIFRIAYRSVRKTSLNITVRCFSKFRDLSTFDKTVTNYSCLRLGASSSFNLDMVIKLISTFSRDA